MKKIFSIQIILFLSVLSVSAKPKQTVNEGVQRPKLVVGIVVDQMRWDFLYRFYDKYENGGFKRLLNEGFSCENTMLNYIPSVTAIGHSTIFTGSVPAIHGIAGNDWFDQSTGKEIYCTDDATVTGVGTTSAAGKMSPRKLLTTTITDELRLASNLQSKVVGVSLKDRASILPAGHNPTGAFWLDDATGNFVTSTYYMNELPGWVQQFNATKPIEKLIANGWNTLLPIDQYTESSTDNVAWEGLLAGAKQPVFPYDLKKAYEQKRSSFRQTPFGNTLTLHFAEAAIEGYQMGAGNATDFLSINCASTDYAGHLFGPNAIEVEDVYLRLDRDLSKFFAYLDEKVGKGNYLVFLTADHGAAHSEGYMEANKMPTGLFGDSIFDQLKTVLEKQFSTKNILLGIDNYQVFFNKKHIDSLSLDFNAIKNATVQFLNKQEGIAYVVDQDKIAEASIPQPLKEMMINGYNKIRSGNVIMVPQPGWLPEYCKTGTTHGLWNPYDTHIPLLFMGWKIKHGTTHQVVEMTDIVPTLASMLHIQMPNGCIGKPITEVINE